MAETGTVLIAVSDAILADSLRFSLELEGYSARLAEPPFDLHGLEPRRCLLLDQDVFLRLADRHGAKAAPLGMPTVLMVNQRTPRLMENAKSAGITTVIEKPLLGGVLFDTIKDVLETASRVGQD